MLITWHQSSVSVEVGQSVTVSFTTGQDYELMRDISTSDSSVATISTTGSGFSGVATIVGVSAGTATTVPGGSDTQNTPLTITVTAPAPVDDDKFLNKRGLTHFWENIDDIKQDKLTAGTNITIAADNTISASQPTVNDATLTIQRNGTNVQTFTANASSNVTANISVPTKTSDLTNDGSDNTAQYLETDETAYKTASIPYGECDSTSTATAFTATVPGITELRDGVCMWLKNGVVTSASGFTININNLGAKPVYNNMAAATRDTTIWNVNYTMLFVYDSTRVEGGCWILYRGYNSDNNTIGYQLRTNSTSLATTDRTRYYRLLFTSADNTHWVPANTQYDNSATSNKTVNQRKINPFGRIVYLGSSTSYLADAAVTATAVWDQYAFNLGYSFAKGSALTMTFPKPVYVKCAPQTDGSAIIDSTTPYVQDLPATEDGKIYIYLGIAYSATNVEMVINHPVYYYKDGAIREWSNAPAAIASVAWGDITGTLSNQTDLNTALGAKANSADLATVATSGSYNDLTNKPTIPAAQVNSDWSANSGVAQILNKPTLATVATSGSYNDLTDKPSIADENYLITVTSFSGSGGTYTFIADRTYAEIEAAYQAGKHLIICADIYRVPDSGYSSTVHEYLYAELSHVGDSGDSNGPTFAFIATTASGSGRSITIWSHNFYIYGNANSPYNTYSVDNASITVTDIISNSQNPISSNAVYTALAAKADASSLAAVATSGSYNDLSNKPTIPTVNNATLTIQKNGTTVNTFTANQSTNATANITVPTKTSDLTNDSGFLDSVAWGDVTGKPTFATVATSGSYDDLSNKPTIPAAQVQANWTQTTTTAVDYIKNKPALSTVATSGSYSDLTNKPTIPTVNNATLTIQKNGTTVNTFTANASSNVTANITVPTSTSDLTNDSGFIDGVSTITNARIDEIMGLA